jgi:hypothetical protein
MGDIGSQSPSNEHIDKLAGILLTYNFYEKDLGSFLATLSSVGHEMLTGSLKVMCRECPIYAHPFT